MVIIITASSIRTRHKYGSKVRCDEIPQQSPVQAEASRFVEEFLRYISVYCDLKQPPLKPYRVCSQESPGIQSTKWTSSRKMGGQYGKTLLETNTEPHVH